MRLPKVCLALSGDTVEDMLATAESMARDNPFHRVPFGLPEAAPGRASQNPSFS